MKSLAISLALLIPPVSWAATPEQMTALVASHQWIHGSADCSANEDPAIEVLAVDPDTYILRQSKCLSAEAPFIYVFFGTAKVFVQDTGDTRDATLFPIYQTVLDLVQARESGDKRLQILVTHSHGHGDHTAGDGQFLGQPDVTLVEPETDAIARYFGLEQWPSGQAELDLGDRLLTIFPIPGHHEQSLAVYDSHSRWLLTGDTVYPGMLIIMDWDDYKRSIQAMADFATQYPVSAIMGTHIEMTATPGLSYAYGTVYQPDEAPLPISVAELQTLNEQLKLLGDKPEKATMDKFVITPASGIQKAVSSVLGWFSG